MSCQPQIRSYDQKQGCTCSSGFSFLQALYTAVTTAVASSTAPAVAPSADTATSSISNVSTTSGTLCVFPFVYDGDNHSACISPDGAGSRQDQSQTDMSSASQLLWVPMVIYFSKARLVMFPQRFCFTLSSQPTHCTHISTQQQATASTAHAHHVMSFSLQCNLSHSCSPDYELSPAPQPKHCVYCCSYCRDTNGAFLPCANETAATTPAILDAADPVSSPATTGDHSIVFTRWVFCCLPLYMLSASSIPIRPVTTGHCAHVYMLSAWPVYISMTSWLQLISLDSFAMMNVILLCWMQLLPAQQPTLSLLLD